MEQIRFGELYSIPSSNGLSRPSKERGEGYRMINMGELFANNIISDMEMERVKMSDRELAKFLVEPDDLLFARQSLVAEGAGKCSIVKQLSEPTTFESHLIRVRLDKQKCNPWFYYYLFQLNNNPVKTIINQCAQAGIRGSELVKVKVPYIDYSEQNEIVSVLKRYDELIENNIRQIQIAEFSLSEIYKEWFVRLRFPGHEEAVFEDDIPERWEFKSVEEVMTFSRGVSYSSEEIDTEDGVNLINLKNIDAYGGFRRDGTKKYSGKYKKSQVVTCGDLIMGVTDMTQDRRTVGAVALIPDVEGTSVISADLVVVNTDLEKAFLYCMCRYGSYSKYFSQFANGANVLHLKPAVLSNKKMLIPNAELIDAFSEIANGLIEMINNLHRENNIVEKNRDMMLIRLMRKHLNTD